jgi:hypothetical protein
MFERGYLDVIELGAPAWVQHLQSSSMYRLGVAPSGIVLSGPSIEKARQTLSQRGIGSDEPYEIVRELPDAEPSTVHYRTSSLRAAGLPLAVLQDSAPQAMRRPDWIRHPNAAIGLTRLHLRVRSSDEACSALRMALNTESTESAIGHEFQLGSTVLALHEDAPNQYLAALANQFTRLRRVTVLAAEFRTGDLEAVQRCLNEGGVPYGVIDWGIAVDPDAGFGCGVIFNEADPKP